MGWPKSTAVSSSSYYQKMSYDQIASVLGAPMKTVETRLYRARKLLRQSLQREGVGGAG